MTLQDDLLSQRSVASCIMCNPLVMQQCNGTIWLFGEEAEASPSIANTLLRVWTMFTRSSITPPEVNGFGWNLWISEHIARSCPWQILGAIRAEAAAGARSEILFICPLNNARFHRLPVGQISRNLHKKTCFRVDMWGFGKHLWKFTRKAVSYTHLTLPTIYSV